MSVIREYTLCAKEDKTITLRNLKYDYYRIKEYDDGHIVLTPTSSDVLDKVSEIILADIEAFSANLSVRNNSSLGGK